MSSAPSDSNVDGVFLSAERSLLAWNRTCIAMVGLGFVIERFNLFLRLLERSGPAPEPRGISSWVGLGLMAFAAVLAILSTASYRQVIASLGPAARLPTRFAGLAEVANLGIAVAGASLSAYLAFEVR
jgi:putative membrane protein